MTTGQTIFLVTFTITALLIFIKGCYESIPRKNPYGLTPLLAWMGIFVWGDAVVLGLFWFVAALACSFLGDWLLFLMLVSLFWIVRSLGETVYWFNQQFSTINRNPPESLKGYHLFQNDAIWFVYQLVWQCVAVVSTVVAISVISQWLAA